MRHKFIGGPNDGQVHLTPDLLTDDKTRNEIPWEEYYNSGEPEPAADGEIPIILWYHIGGAVVPSDEPKSTPSPATGKPEKSGIRLRREALKVKRQEFADMLGDTMTIGVLARVETKGGTDEEVSLIEQMLSKLEAERG